MLSFWENVRATDDSQPCLYAWMGLMPGPSPTSRPCFPLAFLEQARQMVRQRTMKLQWRQRAVLVFLLHAPPRLSKVAAERWAQDDCSLEDEPGRGRQAVFS